MSDQEKPQMTEERKLEVLDKFYDLLDRARKQAKGNTLENMEQLMNPDKIEAFLNHPYIKIRSVANDLYPGDKHPENRLYQKIKPDSGRSLTKKDREELAVLIKKFIEKIS